MSSVLVENAPSSPRVDEKELEEGEVRVCANAREATPPLPLLSEGPDFKDKDEETKKRTRPEQSPPPDHDDADADIFDKEESSPRKKHALDPEEEEEGAPMQEVIVQL